MQDEAVSSAIMLYFIDHIFGKMFDNKWLLIAFILKSNVKAQLNNSVASCYLFEVLWRY